MLQMTKVPNTVNSFYLHDANKNIVQLTNKTGVINTGYAYSPFGYVIGELPKKFGFSSEYLEQENLLLCFNYRQYCPQIGKWFSRDPIGENSGLNIYQFVRNSPLHFYDFLGLACCDGKEFDPKNECCINNEIELKVSDSAGRKCCRDKMGKIYIKNRRGRRFHPIDWGHTFLEIDKIGYGFYIFWGIMDDTGEDNTEKLTYEYKACPVTKAIILTEINIDRIRKPLYSPLNIIGYNCSGRVCYWLEAGGIRAPFDPDTWTLLPVQGGGDKKYGPRRR